MSQRDCVACYGITTLAYAGSGSRETPLFEREGGSRLKCLPSGTHVICSKLDRVFRSTADGLVTMNQFKKHGIAMHFADQSGCTLDLSTGEGEFMFTIMLAAAALEPRRTADRTSKAMKHRQSNGQRMTSVKTIPFGWMLDPDNDAMTIPCPDELAAISEAQQLSAKGVSLREIARRIGPIPEEDPVGSVSEMSDYARGCWLIGRTAGNVLD